MWNNLSMSQRAEVIAMAVKSGLRDINDIKDFYNNSIQTSISNNKYRTGGPIKNMPKRGTKVNTDQCAKWANGFLREHGDIIYGDAWNPRNVDELYNGYEGLEKPAVYSREAVEAYNHAASENVLKNFDSKTLDKNKSYSVNMYYNGSPSLEEAYNNGRGVTGTHTGVLWNDNGQWKVSHNVHGTIHEEPFFYLQSGKRPYGVTTIYEPREGTILNKIKGFFGFDEGGYLNSEDNYYLPYITINPQKNRER